MHDADVAIVGAGIAGSALATTLARQGVSVLLVEKTLRHVDRIRGEWLAPWGVAQAAKIGILNDLIAAGGHYIADSDEGGHLFQSDPGHHSNLMAAR